MTDRRFSCFLIGTESLLISCAETLLERGHDLLGVISDERAIIAWCGTRGVRAIAARPDYTAVLAAQEKPFDYLLSITNRSIVPKAALALPRKGAVNFHDGPLPRFGGLHAPSWALLAGEPEFGVTWHLMTDTVDAGAIILQRQFAIAGDETALTLNAKCFEAGVESFPSLVDLLANGELSGTPHTLDESTYHGLSVRPRAYGALDWTRPVDELATVVRALDFGAYTNPLTRARIVANGRAVSVGRLVAVEGATAEPGTILSADGDILRVAAAGASLALGGLTCEDGAPLDAATALLALGVSVNAGERLPPLDAAFGEAADRFAARAARYEGAWVHRLTTLDPLELPTADRIRSSSTPAKRSSLALAPTRDRDGMVATFALFVGRLAGRTQFDLAFSDARTVGADAGLASLVAAQVPMRIRLDDQATVAEAHETIGQELTWLRRRVGFTRDIAARHAALRALAGRSFSLPVGIALVDRLDDRAPAATDLTLVIARNGAACWEYDAAVLSPERIATMARQFTMALGAPATSTWTALPLLTPAEHRTVVNGWGSAPRPVETDRCIHQLIEAQVQRTPNAVAVVFEDGQLTYAELDTRASRLANHLRALGAGPDTLVALCCERSLDMMVALLGVLKAGAAYVPLDPSYPAERLAYMLEDAQARILVTQEPVLAELPAVSAAIVCMDRDWPAIARRPSAAVPSGVTAANLAYCIYTSGSTGHPKGVMVEHRNVANLFSAMDARLGVEPGVWLAVTSLSFDISVLELLWTLSRGYKVVLYAEEARTAGASLRLANEHKGVDFSLFYFSADENADAGDRYRVLMEGARFGDAHGFTAVWTPERHFHAFGGLYPNPAVTGAAVAAVTTRIGVRAGSCVLPLHHPVRVAEEWSMVDNLSGGRVGISFAAGWQPNDFIFQPDHYADAKHRTVEMIDTVRRLWRGETLTFPGPRGDVPVQTLPRPVQPELPIWFTTAGNPESYELAGQLGVNVLTHLLGQTVDELADKITRYRKAWTSHGHPGVGQVSLMLHTFVGDSDDEVKELVREPMKAYLGTSVSLIKGFASAFPTFKKGTNGASAELDFQSLTAEELDALLEYSFERYYSTSGLFGTVETCARTVDRLKGIGVDDIACLIDFGVETERVLEHLKHLNRLRVRTSRPHAVAADHSVAALVARHRVTHLQCTPAMGRMLVGVDRSRDALRSLRTLCVGGEAFPPALLAELQRVVPGDIHNMYGPTETTIWSTMHTVGDRPTNGSVPLGTPLANNELYVLDAFGQPVAPGVAGELFIGGAQVVRGYWRRPDLTAERFVPNPFHHDPTARLYRTGDRVRWLADGTLEFLGRTDFQVKLRGHRIELGEIEARLATHPDVREAVVMARNDLPDSDARLVAYIVWRTAQENGVGGLREHVRTALPEFMVPSHFVVLNELPRTPNAKLDRKALPSVSLPRAAPVVAAPARVPAAAGTLEAEIARIWQDVLKVSPVGVQDNFFDLGGHSLLAVQVHTRLKKALRRELSITDLFRFPTVRALAGFLEGDADGAGLQRGLAQASQRRERAGRRAQQTTNNT